MPQPFQGPSISEEDAVASLRRAFVAQRGTIAPHCLGGEWSLIRSLHADPARDEPCTAATPSQRSAAGAGH